VNLEPCEPDYLSEYWHADGATGVTWSLTVEDLRATHEGEIADL